MQISKILLKSSKSMIPKIKQCFEGLSVGLQKGELSDREELGSVMRLRVWVQDPVLLLGHCKTEQVISLVCALISSFVK